MATFGDVFTTYPNIYNDLWGLANAIKKIYDLPADAGAGQYALAIGEAVTNAGKVVSGLEVIIRDNPAFAEVLGPPGWVGTVCGCSKRSRRGARTDRSSRFRSASTAAST